MRKNGPIGDGLRLLDDLVELLDVDALLLLDRQISDTDELRMRLTTNPGASPHLIGVFLICWAKFAAA